ncbi:MAG: multidrug effflux MFS transporter [Alphaproteobacteria bacterium]
MTRTNYLILVMLLGILQALPPFSIDTSLAAIPAMAADLITDAGSIQLTLSAYVFGAAAGQLVLSPLSDRYGRKVMMLGGLAAYVIAAIGCAYANSVEMLAAMRFIQGSSTFAGRILPRAMARDLYDREEAAKLLSYMAVFSGMAPIVAPLIGATLLDAYGWRSIFVFMIGYGIVTMILVALFLKESLPPERRIMLGPATMAANLLIVMRNRAFLSYGACIFCTMGGLMCFLTSSSSVFIIFLKQTPQQYAYAFGGIMIAYSLFSFIAGRLVSRIGIDGLIHSGAVIGCVSGLAMWGSAVAGYNTMWALIIPMFGYIAALSFILPQATAGALSPFGDMAGSAMSNLGFIQTCIAATIAGISGLLFDGTQMPMVAIIAVMGIGSLVSYYGLVRPLRNLPSKS